MSGSCLWLAVRSRHVLCAACFEQGRELRRQLFLHLANRPTVVASPSTSITTRDVGALGCRRRCPLSAVTGVLYRRRRFARNGRSQFQSLLPARQERRSGLAGAGGNTPGVRYHVPACDYDGTLVTDGQVPGGEFGPVVDAWSSSPAESSAASPRSSFSGGCSTSWWPGTARCSMTPEHGRSVSWSRRRHRSSLRRSTPATSSPFRLGGYGSPTKLW